MTVPSWIMSGNQETFDNGSRQPEGQPRETLRYMSWKRPRCYRATDLSAQVGKADLLGSQPNDKPPRYGKDDPAAETGAEDVERKLESLKEH